MIDLFLNENGYIVSAHIATNNATCPTLNVSTLDTKNDLTYKVSLRLQSSDNGPQYENIARFILLFFFCVNRPEIQHFLDKLKREKEAKLNTDSDNRPFVLKYVSKKNKKTFVERKSCLNVLVEISVTNCDHFSCPRRIPRWWQWWSLIVDF